MAQLEIKNLTFTYPLGDGEALRNINLKINSGEFITVCGKSGCGKTTLLRLIKNEIAPKGNKSGKILLYGEEIETVNSKISARKIGFVMQNPDTQIVTDKVWHELCFGLENLGFDTNEIASKVAEAVSYFGIGNWYNKNINELSGGQKQILNLASIMAMNPEILILDEPTSQLDPIAAENFLNTLKKLNRDFGVTVIITEHRLEEIFPISDRIIVMENGKIFDDTTPAKIGNNLKSQVEFVKESAPTIMKIFSESNADGLCPMTVREARNWLSKSKIKNSEFHFSPPPMSKTNIIEAKNLHFAYSKESDDILKGLDLAVPENSIFVILGANGAGKSTMIKVLSGIEKPYRGKVKINGKDIKKYKGNELYRNNIAVLPQDVTSLFTADTVRGDLESINKEKLTEICELTEIFNLLDRHPYDISGGEQQRSALGKVLLTEPKILIMDEPTKGMDSLFKIKFAEILSKLKDKGVTVVMISHDIEFAAKYADVCALLFDGKIASVNDTHAFFSNNHFYTTEASRVSRGYISGVVTHEEVIECIKGK